MIHCVNNLRSLNKNFDAEKIVYLWQGFKVKKGLLFFLLFQGHLNTYRFCDNVWTFVLNNVEFREVGELVKVEKVKVVACDGKGLWDRQILQ